MLCVHWFSVSICNCWKVGQCEDSNLDGQFLLFAPIPSYISWHAKKVNSVIVVQRGNQAHVTFSMAEPYKVIRKNDGLR